MGLPEDFTSAQERVKTLSSTPSNDTLLQLYSLYKQGSTGDVAGKRPGMLDMRGRAKWDAWNKCKGMTKDEAMQKYVDLVDSLVG